MGSGVVIRWDDFFQAARPPAALRLAITSTAYLFTNSLAASNFGPLTTSGAQPHASQVAEAKSG